MATVSEFSGLQFSKAIGGELIDNPYSAYDFGQSNSIPVSVQTDPHTLQVLNMSLIKDPVNPFNHIPTKQDREDAAGLAYWSQKRVDLKTFKFVDISLVKDPEPSCRIQTEQDDELQAISDYDRAMSMFK